VDLGDVVIKNNVLKVHSKLVEVLENRINLNIFS